MGSIRGYSGSLVLAVALLCLGLLVPVAGAAEFKYTLDPELSLTGDCSTSTADPVPDPDCEPTYSAPPNGPSGRFDRPFSLAVDDWGNQYVASRSADGSEGRIDIFDSEGRFLTELDDPFGPQSVTVDGEGNLYVFEVVVGIPGEDPKVVRYQPTTYNPAAGEIEYDPADRTTVAEFPNLNFNFNGLAIDRADAADPSDDRLYIAEGERISIYASAEDGSTLVDRIEPTGFNFAHNIAVDAERRLLYTTHCKEGPNKCVVWVLEADAPYSLVKEISGSQIPAGKFFSTEGKISIAVDEITGHLFIGDLAARDDIYELDEDYNFVSTFEIPGGALGGGVQSDVAENLKAPDPEGKNPDDNYRYLYVPLSAASGSAIAFAPPAVTSPKIVEGPTAVNIGETEAELEARIHPGQLETTYAIEYVSEAQFEVDGFASATVAKSGTIPGLSSPQRVSVVIGGLTPGESYRFRVVSENEFGSEEAEATFATYDDAPTLTVSCPNQTLRVGPSAALPDCRAWELVTPPGARGPAGAGLEGDRFGMVQSSPSGNAVSFELTSGALLGTEATGYFFGDPYLATRSASGWSTQLAGPSGTQASKPRPGSFSPDQGYSFWTAEGQGSAIIGGKPTRYVRYPDERSELVGRGSLDTDPRALGMLITEGGAHIVFQTTEIESAVPQKLEPNAPEEGITAVYDRTLDEVTHVVSLLPGGMTPAQDASYVGASADGEGIAFEVAGTLYLRVGNEVTHLIGAGLTFAGVSDGGDRIFYIEGGDLKAFDTSSEEEIDFTGVEISTAIPVNVAPQGNRAYFVSATAVGGANPNGDVAQPDAQNLYLSEDGAITFVATVTERDVEGTELGSTGIAHDGLGLWARSLKERRPAIDPSRLTPDGSVFTFQSRATLDGYESGKAPQIYRYDSVAERLHCVSCSPTKTPATGGAALQSITAVTLGAPLSHYGFVPALRADGARLFFESTEALVSKDIDRLRDVYEWEEQGVGSCTRAGGCVYLISSGRSASPDFLFGHSQSGNDVFVSTYDVLTGSGEEAIAIYDARVGGGFVKNEPLVCVEEFCRPAPASPPALLTPESGVNDPSFKPPRQVKKCPPGKHKVKRKGKAVCIKKHKRQRHKQRKGAAKREASR